MQTFWAKECRLAERIARRDTHPAAAPAGASITEIRSPQPLRPALEWSRKKAAFLNLEVPMRASLLFVCLLVPAAAAQDTPLKLELKSRTGKEGTDIYVVEMRKETWKPSETALIVCDMWDAHHCLNAVRREEELTPRMNEVLEKTRGLGVFIIHAPSSCMDAYKDHPGRKRAQAAPPAKTLPKEIDKWCHKIPAEEKGKYPIDQSDGGEDDDLKEHEAWHAKLKAMGLNPRAPWRKQHEGLRIDDKDAISDSGVEIWNMLEERSIKNVILVGVHTNMCVLGRPFGLRQMAKNGKNVVLVRDLTDTMYNPKAWPYVSHFEGTRQILAHIEKFVCPTITSDQLAGGAEFRFKGDK
jgi:nicotinamidase-related amidase